MDLKKFNNDQIKGILFIVGGIFILMHTLGLLPGFNILLILGSLVMIAYGAYKSGLWKKIMALSKKSSRP